MTEIKTHFTHATTPYWQEILGADDPSGQRTAPYRYCFPARFADGRILDLPLRAVPNSARAVASLIANQASFTVTGALISAMVPLAESMRPDLIVGLPTLGLAFAPGIAEAMGHENYIPLGYSRKFWYLDRLSVPVRSITSPGEGKALFIDPNMVPRLTGKRIVIVDDAVSSGNTMAAALTLLAKLDCDICGIVTAMRQGVTWRSSLEAVSSGSSALVKSPLSAPIFERVAQGWVPIDGTWDN